MCRIGGCRKAAFYRGKDYQAVAERVLQYEMTPEVTERMEYVLRHETVSHLMTLKFERKDLPSKEDFEQQVAACSTDELKQFNNLDERVDMVLSKH